MNKLTSIFLLASLMVILNSSCIRRSDETGRAYMPDMVYSDAYDANSENPLFKSGMTSQLSAPGAISRNGYTYPIPNTPEGYILAVTAITNPFTFTKEEVEGEGKKLFNIYCAICHGEKGDGQGTLPGTGKFPNPPSFYSEALLNKPEGQYYHSVMYGRNMMGSYALQLDHKERWMVLTYVKKLQADNATPAASAPATTTVAK